MTDLILPPFEIQAELPAERHPAAVYLSTKAPSGRDALLRVLDQAAQILTSGAAGARELAWHRLGYQHTAAVIAAMRELRSPATANLTRAAIRGVLKEAWRLGLMTAEQCQRASDMPAVKGSREPVGRVLELAEIRALLQVCKEDHTPAGARDGAFIALGYGCGLRRMELIGMNREDCDLEQKSIRVRGKGAKERTVYIPEGTSSALINWLQLLEKSLNPFVEKLYGPSFWGILKKGPIFLPIRKNYVILRRRLNPSNAAHSICRKRAELAGVKPFSVHDLRRSYISHLLDAGADISTVSRLVGHADISTTRIYDRRLEEPKKRAVTLIHVPW